ncbi:MAG: FAD-dependent oxidoreductase, partial [Brachybacterium sp.]|nr:FAD-dependent oxidoreductase [Brachybacterium sp.]
MIHEHHAYEIVVIGGGLAGVCAANGAARRGARVALIQNRPVLGGNSSSEVRVWVCGATAHGVHHFARETGLMGELFVENQYRNPEGNPYYWDLLLLEKVRAEEHLDLFLNTEVTQVEADGPQDDRVITSVTGWMSGSERSLTFTAATFIDCSGDGLVGHLAGAEYMTGREPRSRWDEPWAPEVPDSNTLGSTILFYSKDIGEPSKFVPPPFAVDITTTAIPDRRIIRHTMNGCDYWWIEWGGEMDVVQDNERIRDELQNVCYGIWDYIKNSGKFDADTLTLEWIGAVPGKREYRRFIGDHILIQQEVLEQHEFEDRVAFGGWSIDLHPAGGIYAEEKGSLHWHPDGNYHIPLRSLYSRNVRNMWMAGRNISASHVAFGSTRVMATCGVLGEAVGIAAAVALEHEATPRQVTRDHLPEVHRAMVRADASMLGVENTDPSDLARTAAVSASSTRTHLSSTTSTRTHALTEDLALVLPVDPELDGLELLLTAEGPTDLTVELFDTSRPQNYLPDDDVQSTTVPVPTGRNWVTIPLHWTPAAPQNAFVVFRANPGVAVHEGAAAPTGTLTLRYRELPADERFTEQWRPWKQIHHGRGICFRTLA